MAKGELSKLMRRVQPGRDGGVGRAAPTQLENAAPGEPVTLASIGSGLASFMSHQEIDELKAALTDNQTRLELAAYISGKFYPRMFRGNGDMTETDKVREIVRYGIGMYLTLSEVSVAEGWPEDTSPPEFFELVRREMTTGGNGA